MTNPLLAESRGTQNTTTGKMSLRLVNKSGVNIAQVTTVVQIINYMPDKISSYALREAQIKSILG